MHILRSVALCLLALPLMLNGLWVICHDAAPAPKTQESAQAQSPDDELKAECEKLCARQSSLCLVSPGDTTSLSIVVLGVAIFPSHLQVTSPRVSREHVREIFSSHSDPSIAEPSPPPEV
jgi:hypothetical protein